MRRWLGRGRAPLPEQGTPVGQPGTEVLEFEASLARLSDRAGPSRLLLAALAWGRGSGLPSDLWIVVAQALAGERGWVSAADVAWLLKNGRTWIASEAVDGGRPSCHLRDESITAHLRDVLVFGAVPWGQRPAEAERRISEALLATVPVRPGGQRDWMAAGRYLRTHLAEHAAAAGVDTLTRLVTDPGFLAVADPGTLMPLLGPLALTAREVLRAYRRARPLISGDPHANVAHLAEANWGMTGGPGDVAAAAAVRPLYHTLLASVRRDDSLLTLSGHTGHLNEVAFGVTADGTVLLASASDDKTVRVWDALSGEPRGEPITGHTDEVWSVAFGTVRGDGETGGSRLLLASCSKDATVRVWDPDTGAPVIPPITGHAERVYEVQFGNCPDGRLLLASGSADKTVRVWDPLTGAPVNGPLGGYAGRVRSVAFGTLQGEEGECARLLLAAGGPDGPLRVWDPVTGRPVCTITGEAGHVYEVRFHRGPNGELLLAGGGFDHPLRFFDPVTGEPVEKAFPMLSNQAWTAAKSTEDNGRQLVAATAGHTTIHIWDAADASAELATLVSHAGMVQDVVFGKTPDGRPLLASCSGDRTVRIWDRMTSSPPEPPIPHLAWVSSLAFATVPGDGERLLLASASDEKALNVWDPHAAERVTEFPGLPGWLAAVAFGTTPGEGGRLLLASASNERGSGEVAIHVWDAVSGQLVTGPLRGHREAIRALAFGTTPGEGGRLLLASSGDDGTVLVWDPLTGEALGDPVSAHTGGTDALALTTTPDGGLLLATGGGDCLVRLWDPLAGTAVDGPLTGHTSRIRSVSFGAGPRGRLLLASASDDHTIRVWEPLAHHPPKTLAGHTDWVAAAAFGSHPEGLPLLVSGGGDNTVRVWDPVSGGCVLTIQRESVVRTLSVTGMTVAIGEEEGFSVIELDPASVR